MREKFDSLLAVLQKKYEYDYKKHVRKAPVFKKCNLVFVDRAPLAVVIEHFEKDR